jgi:hypothetical protein
MVVLKKLTTVEVLPNVNGARLSLLNVIGGHAQLDPLPEHFHRGAFSSLQ